jgi:hypothetical protein
MLRSACKLDTLLQDVSVCLNIEKGTLLVQLICQITYSVYLSDRAASSHFKLTAMETLS